MLNAEPAQVYDAPPARKLAVVDCRLTTQLEAIHGLIGVAIGRAGADVDRALIGARMCVEDALSRFAATGGEVGHEAQE